MFDVNLVAGQSTSRPQQSTSTGFMSYALVGPDTAVRDSAAKKKDTRDDSGRNPHLFVSGRVGAVLFI
jgi:hypothetical protein